MDGIHDLGGKHGYGPVIREKDEPAFHERWEAAVFTMLAAARQAGAFNNSDRFRHSIERIEPAAYLLHTYYGRWLGGIETLLVEAGVLTTAEINQRSLARGAQANDLVAARPRSHPDPQGDGHAAGTARRKLTRKPRYQVGDQVITWARVIEGHTRLPAYARGKRGRIQRCHEGWVYPDSNAHGGGEDPQFLYTVAFDGHELWGPTGEANLTVHLDLFEPYLEPGQ